MSWIAAAILGAGALSAGASIIGSGNASGAATQAATVQANAAQQATDLQKQIYDSTKAGLAPFVSAGAGLLPQVNSLVAGATDANGNPVAPNASLAALQGLTAGGSNPLVTSANSFVAGSGAPPAPALTNLQSIGDPNNAANTAARSFVAGSGVAPSAALSNLQSATSQTNPNQLAVNSNVAKQQTANLGDINQRYQDAYKSALKSGQSEADFLKSDTFKGFQNELNNYYANDASPSEVASQLAFQQSRLADPGQAGYADSAKQLINTLTTRQNNGTPANQSLALTAAQGFLPGSPNANAALKAVQDLTPGAATPGAALSGLNALLGLSGPGGAPDSAAISAALAATPGYQFTLSQGLKAVQNSNAAKGLGSSGAALRGAADYASGLAGATYEQRLTDYLNNYNSQFTNAQNAYNTQGNLALNQYTGGAGVAQNATNSQVTNALNSFSSQQAPALNTLNSLTANAQGNYNTQQTPALNTLNTQFTNANTGYGTQSNVLTNLVNTGENAGAQTGAIGVQTGANAANTITGGAAAQAGGIVGSSNALTNGLVNTANTVGNTATTLALLNNQPANPSIYQPSAGAGSNNPLISPTPFYQPSAGAGSANALATPSGLYS